MAGPIDYTTLRSTYAMQALGTLGTCPTWDAALHRYLAAEALQHADMEFGRFYEADEEHSFTVIRLEGQYGPAYPYNPRAAEVRDAAYAKLMVAEKQRDTDYIHPYWQACRDLAMTPAPSLAAAVFKVNMIIHDEPWNDSRMAANCMELVKTDFARLAGEA